MNYNDSMNKIRKQYDIARKAFIAAYQADTAAAEEARKAEFQHKVHHSPETEHAMYATKAAAVKAADAMKKARVVMDDVYHDAVNTRKVYKEWLESSTRANPQQVDMAGVALIQSGMMSAADLAGFCETYKGNATMLRLVAAECENRMKGTTDREEVKAYIPIREKAKECYSDYGNAEKLDAVVAALGSITGVERAQRTGIETDNGTIASFLSRYESV